MCSAKSTPCVTSSLRSPTSPWTMLTIAPSNSAVGSAIYLSACMLGISARRSSPRSTTRIWNAARVRSNPGSLHSQERDLDAFLVTLTKSEADYSPTTMYQDYAISPTLFHWESQSSTTVKSATGQRYLNHRQRGTDILIFARQHKRTDGVTDPYLFLGPAAYTTHTGERPIAITWQLTHPMPTEVFQAASVVA